jgi:conjugal transfer/type IV secretion protein DotA/TraY
MGPKQKVHDQCGSFNVPYHQYPLSLTNQGRVAGYDPMKARAQQEYGDAIEQLINHPALTKIARAFAEDCDGKQGCKNKDNLSKFNNLTYDYTFTPPGGNPQTTPVEYPSILYMLISDFMSNLTDDLYSDAKNEISDALHHSGGWAGAGSLFIQIAHINGQLAEAVNSGGDIESYSSESPEGVGGSTSPCTATQEFFSGDWFLGWNDCEPAKVDIQVARTIDLAQTWWGDEAAGDKRIAPPEDLARDASTGSKSVTASSAAKDYLIAKITPNHAFFNFDDNAGKNPLATLSLIGGSAIQWSTFTFGTAILADGFGYSAFSSALFFLGGVGFGAGFLLHYALPLLPYFYFFLAVLGFAISVFEAIMGMPLFALAHLDVNADGIVGKAKQGYVTLFLLLIEPVLIILALMASLLFFTAGIHFLNATFNVAVDVISGVEKTAFYDPVGGVSGSGDTSWYDWIIYTVLYAVFAFGVGNASFKLIDILPNKVIRWLGEQAELAGADSAAATNYLDKVALGAGAVAGNAIQQAGGLAGAAGKKLRGESQSQEIADGVAGGLRKAGETAAESPGDENT